ncbi:hypothetical protein SAMN05216362_12939 [Piscibacillus halophilus]|uniref:Uncharacterized protein n=1 Tax=Piscibacillus halophilus TaxID=571933 RepID=A0A1H9JB16_9BACI|nr:hypothetical protein SAMN05216362_12939 [Piscibacillus halophilus]
MAENFLCMTTCLPPRSINREALIKLAINVSSALTMSERAAYIEQNQGGTTGTNTRPFY